MEAIIAWAQTQDWWGIISGVVLIATSITIVFPSVVKDWTWWNVFMKVVNKFAGSMGHGKLADDKTKIVIK